MTPLPSIETALAAWLAEGRARLGQVLIQPEAEGRYSLRHRDDAQRTGLQAATTPEDALSIARDDDQENYRPLKTAPNLRRGWLLTVDGLPALRLALDGFYPGRLGAFLLWKAGALPATPLRETLGRQTGMYRVAGKLTDEQAVPLVGRFCRSDGGCLRTILWRLQSPDEAPIPSLPPAKFDPALDQTGAGETVLPLLCQEACNLLVAEAREVVKGKR